MAKKKTAPAETPQAEVEEVRSLHDYDGPMDHPEKILTTNFVTVLRTDLEDLLTELWMLKGKTAGQAHAIAALATQNMDAKTNPKTDAAMRIEKFSLAVAAEKVTSYIAIGAQTDGNIGIVFFRPDNMSPLTIAGLATIAQSYITDILKAGQL